MGCTGDKSDDEGYEEDRYQRRRIQAHHHFQEDEEIAEEEPTFKDFEEIGSKKYNLIKNNRWKNNRRRNKTNSSIYMQSTI